MRRRGLYAEFRSPRRRRQRQRQPDRERIELHQRHAAGELPERLLGLSCRQLGHYHVKHQRGHRGQRHQLGDFRRGKTLTLQGTATNSTIGGIISDGTNAGQTTAITKTGTGTWTFGGSSTYTGATTVTGGTLATTNAVQGFGLNLSGVSVGGSGTLSLLNNGSVSFTNGTLAYNIANSASGATIGNVDRVSGTGSNIITVGSLTTTSPAATCSSISPAPTGSASARVP